MNSSLQGLLDLFFPANVCCLACGNRLTRKEPGPLCFPCEANLVPLPHAGHCPRCGALGRARGCLNCLGEAARMLDGFYAPFAHETTARDLVRALKYLDIRDAASMLAPSMAQFFIDMPGAYDVLVPIPLHHRRLRERGYNQAELLAQSVSSHCGLQVANALIRVVDTRQQATLSAKARSENVSAAFAWRDSLTGKRVLLVDDVCTTGATAAAAAIVCRCAGAYSVGLLTATRPV